LAQSRTPKSTAGNGLSGQVTYIQWLFTDGGKPRAEGRGNTNAEVLVEYSAWYVFYVPLHLHLRGWRRITGRVAPEPKIPADATAG
jgi:hypothetical protein